MAPLYVPFKIDSASIRLSVSVALHWICQHSQLGVHNYYISCTLCILSLSGTETCKLKWIAGLDCTDNGTRNLRGQQVPK